MHGLLVDTCSTHYVSLCFGAPACRVSLITSSYVATVPWVPPSARLRAARPERGPRPRVKTRQSLVIWAVYVYLQRAQQGEEKTAGTRARGATCLEPSDAPAREECTGQAIAASTR